MDEDKLLNKLKSNPDYLIGIPKGLEELRRGNKEVIRQSQIFAVSEINKIVSNLNRYFFTIALLLIPIIFSLVTLSNVREILNNGDSVLISEAFIFLLASLLCGLAHMLHEYFYWKKAEINFENQIKTWSVSFWPGVPLPSKIAGYIEEYNKTVKKVDEISAKLPKETLPIFLILQFTFLFIGIAQLASIAFRLLP